MRGVVRRRWVLYSWVGAAAALTATDWPTGLLTDFWVDHAMAAGVVSGLVLLGLAVFVVDGWLRERESRSWQRVGRIAFKALGRSVEEVREGMDQLLTGRFPHANGAIFTRPFSDRIEAVLAANPAWTQVDAQDEAGDDHAARLGALMSDTAWLQIADEGLKVIRWRHRDRISAWVAPMLTSDQLARTIDRVAQMNELVNDFHDPLHALLVRRETPRTGRVSNDALAGIGFADIHDLAVERWQLALVEAVSIQEDLNRAAGDHGFVNVTGRRRLRDDERRLLDEREDASTQPWVSVAALPKSA